MSTNHNLQGHFLKMDLKINVSSNREVREDLTQLYLHQMLYSMLQTHQVEHHKKSLPLLHKLTSYY